MSIKRVLLCYLLFMSFLGISAFIECKPANFLNDFYPNSITLTEKWYFTTGSDIDSTACVIDMNHDGEKEILFGGYDSYLYCLDKDKNILWSYKTGDQIMCSPTIGDINRDGVSEVFIGSNDNKLYCLSEEGKSLWNFTTADWVVSSPTLFNIDNDLDLEILFGSNDDTFYCLDTSGTVLDYFNALGDVYQTSSVIDIEDDGEWEIIMGSVHSQGMFCLDSNLTEIWNYPTATLTWSSPTAADLDSDGYLEFIFGSRDDILHCVDDDGSYNWEFLTGGDIDNSPVIGDIDADSQLEILFGSKDGKIYCLNADGSEKWNYTSGGSIGLCSPSLGDLDGDGKLEVVFGNEANKIICLDYNGNLLNDFTTGGLIRSSPVLADIDGDNILEILVGSYDNNFYCLDVSIDTTQSNGSWYTFRGSIFHTGWQDSDNDLLDDLTEILHGSNKLLFDTDAEGLNDSIELLFYGTNMTLSDTDYDLFTDKQEVDAGTDPLDPLDYPITPPIDTDLDGLTDAYELLIGTNPDDSDSDDDLLSDGDEVNTYSTDPLDSDSDNDSLSDWEEVNSGVDGYLTDPNDADSDNDLAPDGWEVSYGLNPTIHDGTNDIDLDGLINIQEYFANTDPTNNDCDDDGLTDGYEVFTSYTDPLNNDTDTDGLTDFDEILIYHTNPFNADSDGDGYSDLFEVQNDFDPLDPHSYPRDDNLVRLLLVIGCLGSLMIVIPIFFIIYRKYKTGQILQNNRSKTMKAIFNEEKQKEKELAKLQKSEKSLEKQQQKEKMKQQLLIIKMLSDEALSLVANNKWEEVLVKTSELLKLDPKSIMANKMEKLATDRLRQKKIILDILPQFQPEIPVNLQRIAQLTNMSPTIAEEILETILIQQPSLGKYLKLENVFIRQKDTEKLLEDLRAPVAQKHYTCYFCGYPLTTDTKSCSDCHKEVLICSVCKLPISFGDEIGSCSLCETKGHLTHMQEWVKTQGKCPVCLQTLPIEGIIPEEISKAKKK